MKNSSNRMRMSKNPIVIRTLKTVIGENMHPTLKMEIQTRVTMQI
jgi:hypothetical protein